MHFTRRLAYAVIAIIIALTVGRVLTGKSHVTLNSQHTNPPLGHSQTRIQAGAQSEISVKQTEPKNISDLARNSDVRAAMRLYSKASELSDPSEHDWIDFARRLAVEAPEEGFEWLLGLSSFEHTKIAMLAFATALHERDSVTGLRMLEKALASSSALRAPFCAGVIKVEAVTSLDSACDIIERASRSEDDKDSYLRGLASRLYSEKNYEAIVKMAEKFPAQTDAIFFGEAIYDLWKNDPAGAQQQLDRIPDEELVVQVCNSLALQYGESQPQLAADWVNSLPEGRIRDVSAAGLARALSNTTPLESVKWSVAIQDEKVRAAALSTLIGPGIVKDLAATRHMVAEAGLPEAETAKWMDFIDKSIPVWLPPDTK